jgi:cytochrome c oxidase assembly factor CtaG
VAALLIAAVAVPYLVAASRRTAWLGRWRLAAGASGLLALAAALLPPLDIVATQLFSAHMVQHLLLVVVAAPLLVLGRPFPTVVAAFPADMRRTLGRLWRSAPLRRVWMVVRWPPAAWGLHVTALWAWHVPWLYDGALRVPWLHAVEHTCLFGTALMFWGVVAEARGRRRLGVGGGLLYLFSGAMQCSMLGALIAPADRPWYAAHGGTTAAWGLSPLEDQELAGLIMWIPASVVYLVAVLAIVAGWLPSGDRRGSGDRGRRRSPS